MGDDFKRKVLWGEVESRIKLQGEASQMINNYVGGSSAITSLPVDKELTHSIDPATDKKINPKVTILVLFCTPLSI